MEKKILNKSAQEQLAHPKGTKGLKVALEMFETNAEVIDKLTYYLKSSNNLSIVDIGCGPAYSLIKLNAICNNCKIYGIDNSELVLRVARNKLTNISDNDRGNKLELIYGASPNIPVKNSSIDAVILCNVVYYWNDLSAHIKSISDKLKREGTVLIYIRDAKELKSSVDSTANIYSFYSISDLQKAFLEKKLILEKQESFTTESGELGHIIIFKKH